MKLSFERGNLSKMVIKNYIYKEQYYDSVFLMRLAGKVSEAVNVKKMSVGMGTPLNKDTLIDLGILSGEGEKAGPNDLIVAIGGDNQEIVEKAKDEFLGLLKDKNKSDEKTQYRSLRALAKEKKDINLAIISVAGEFAADQADEALDSKMNVFMFSDNVPLEQEVMLKQKALDKGLLLMGPGCGLSFIGGVAVGLCSMVRRGDIGIVGASGSGIQEVMCMIHWAGMGVSQVIGTGGRDLSREVGGITMIQGIRELMEDDDTSVVVLISKPPAKETVEKILNVVRKYQKPTIIHFIGGDIEIVKAAGAIASCTFEQTAGLAVAIAKGEKYKPHTEEEYMAEIEETAMMESGKMQSDQKYLRGIYCGGSLAEETLILMEQKLGRIYANMAFDKENMLPNPFESKYNTIIDIGDEDFTHGRPHVAIDPTVRVDRFIKEARDKETAVVLMDFLLGYALHEDPAGVMAETIKTEKKLAAAHGRYLSVIASICGSDMDPQNYDEQKKKLQDAGVIVMDNNGAAARMAASVIEFQKER